MAAKVLLNPEDPLQICNIYISVKIESLLQIKYISIFLFFPS